MRQFPEDDPDDIEADPNDLIIGKVKPKEQ